MNTYKSEENCVFCRIVAGTLPCYKIFENERFLAFLDINPRAPGHTLIIPKDHHRWVWDVPASEIGEYFEVTRKIALAERKAFGVDPILCRITGEDVAHAHIWVLPDSEKTPGDKKSFEENAQKIKQNLPEGLN